MACSSTLFISSAHWSLYISIKWFSSLSKCARHNWWDLAGVANWAAHASLTNTLSGNPFGKFSFIARLPLLFDMAIKVLLSSCHVCTHDFSPLTFAPVSSAPTTGALKSSHVFFDKSRLLCWQTLQVGCPHYLVILEAHKHL